MVAFTFGEKGKHSLLRKYQLKPEKYVVLKSIPSAF